VEVWWTKGAVPSERLGFLQHKGLNTSFRKRFLPYMCCHPLLYIIFPPQTLRQRIELGKYVCLASLPYLLKKVLAFQCFHTFSHNLGEPFFYSFTFCCMYFCDCGYFSPSSTLLTVVACIICIFCVCVSDCCTVYIKC